MVWATLRILFISIQKVTPDMVGRRGQCNKWVMCFVNPAMDTFKSNGTDELLIVKTPEIMFPEFSYL